MNYGMSGKGSSGLSSFESGARAAARQFRLQPQEKTINYSGTRCARAAINALGYCPYSPSYDGDMGLGSIWGKNPFGGSSKNVFNQIGKAIIAPIRAMTAPVLQIAGLKTAAREVNNGLYSKGSLKTIGTVGQVAVIAAATYVTAGAVLGAGGTAGTGVAAASTSGGLFSTVGSAIGVAAKALTVTQLASGIFGRGASAQQQAGGGNGGGQQIDAQGFYDAGVADGQNGAARQQIGNAEAQGYYDQGYAAGQAAAAQSGAAGAQIDAQAFYDQGVADAINGKVSAKQAVAEGQQYYDQGYADARKQLIAAKAFYDQGVADAQAGKPMGTVSDPDGQILYEKGYTEALAVKQPLVSEIPSVVQAQAGNSMTGTSAAIVKETKAVADSPMTAGLFDRANMGKVAAIASSLLILGFVFSNQNPMFKRSK